MELKRHFDVLVPGNYFCDIIFTGLPAFPALGQELYTNNLAVVAGGVMNTVVALRRLGINVGWSAALGNDFFSHFALHQTRNEGVDDSLLQHLDHDLRRVTVALSYPKDRAFVSCVDPAPEDIDLTLAAMDRATFPHLHLSGLLVDERALDFLKMIREQGICISMDCQHSVETITGSPFIRQVLSLVDIFMPNGMESKQLTQTTSVDEALSALSELVPYVVIKDGANGALANREGVLCREPALPLPHILDTTGAGDVFNAGFLAAYFDHRDVQECLRWGNFCGGMSTQGWGGVSTAPTRTQLEAWLAEQVR